MCIFRCLLVLLALSTIAIAAQKGATVYIYMPDGINGFKKTAGDIYLDDKKTVDLSKAHYFVLHLTAGKHSFYAKDKKFGGIDLDALDGNTYYVKIDARFEAGKTRIHSVSVVPKEEGEFAIRQYKPIKKEDVYDSALVDMSVISPK